MNDNELRDLVDRYGHRYLGPVTADLAEEVLRLRASEQRWQRLSNAYREASRQEQLRAARAETELAEANKELRRLKEAK